MSEHREHPPIPPGPADADYPRRALARLAVAEQARQLAERATNALVPTGTGYARGDDAENVAIAYQLVDDARELLSRTVIEARERGASWDAIGEAHGDITRQAAHERYADAFGDWQVALDRPFTHSGRFVSSRIADGLEDPARTAARLDAWAAAHVAAGSFPRQQAEHTETGLVSAGLDAHSALTRWNTALRYREHLQARAAAGETVRADEWDRCDELTARARAAAETEQREADTGPA